MRMEDPLQPRLNFNKILAAYFNATKDEFNKAGETMENAAELREGGYLAAIGVYHELHCLVWCRSLEYEIMIIDSMY